MELQDSGNRREFDSGAVRDINEGKGRCDLLPLGVIADMIDDEILCRIDHSARSSHYHFPYPLSERESGR